MVKTACYNEKYFMDLGYSEDQAKEFVGTLSGQEADDLKFYRMLGYSLIESEYLAVNTFNTVKTPIAKASLGVPSGFSKTRGIVQSRVETTKAVLTSFGSGLINNSSPNGFDELDELFGAQAPGFNESLEDVGSFDDLEMAESADYFDEDDMMDCDECLLDGISFESAPSVQLQSSYQSELVNSIGENTQTGNMPHERYNRIADKSNFKDVLTSPTSTFRATVNTASFNHIKDKILKRDYGGDYDYDDAIRTEEVINYFDYKFDKQLNAELATFDNKDYLLVGIKGDKVENQRNNIVLLVDTSGSMGQSDTLLQKAIMTVVKQLGPNDLISLVTYSTTDRVIFTALQADRLSDIILSLNKINIEGCTNGSKGLEQAYKIASDNFIAGGNNRIVILTDGDFNFGVYNQSELAEFIKEKKQTGVFLTVIGTSASAVYEEQLMETLAREGNGNYFRVSDDIDILETLQKRFTKNSIAVAKDVKMQIEFNPAVVDKYRLVGYETRQLNHEDFRNDKVESETLGNEQVVIALYELIMQPNKEATIESKYKYQKISTVDSRDIGTLYLRYKGINKEDTESKEVSLEIPNNKVGASQNMMQALLGESFVELATYPNKEAYKKVYKILALIKDDSDAKFDLIRTLADRKKSYFK